MAISSSMAAFIHENWFDVYDRAGQKPGARGRDVRMILVVCFADVRQLQDDGVCYFDGMSRTKHGANDTYNNKPTRKPPDHAARIIHEAAKGASPSAAASNVGG